MKKESSISKFHDIDNVKSILWENDFEDYIFIELDGKNLTAMEDFIRSIYKKLNCTEGFWLNWNAFWDTIRDDTFWVKKPLVIVFKNYKSCFWINYKDRYILSDILIDLISLEKQKYYIFL